MKAELEAQADRVEALAGPDRETDVMIGRARGLVYPDGPSGGQWGGSFSPCPYYTASLDAAMTLVPEGWTLFHLDGPWNSTAAHVTLANNNGLFCEGEAASPALALTAAALRALAAEKEGGE